MKKKSQLTDKPEKNGHSASNNKSVGFNWKDLDPFNNNKSSLSKNDSSFQNNKSYSKDENKYGRD